MWYLLFLTSVLFLAAKNSADTEDIYTIAPFEPLPHEDEGFDYTTTLLGWASIYFWLVLDISISSTAR